jgi:hypothetical protein
MKIIEMSLLKLNSKFSKFAFEEQFLKMATKRPNDDHQMENVTT